MQTKKLKTQREKQKLLRNLKTLRLQANLTQIQLAHKTGFSVSSISRWESELPIRITRRNLQKLADTLKVTINDLYKSSSIEKTPIFNSKLRELREKKGLTQKQIAKKANITASYVSYLERNPFAYPKQEIMHKITQALELPATNIWDTSKIDGLSTEEQILFRAYKRLHRDNRRKLFKMMKEEENE